jgi:hypothetical protein
VEDFWAWRSRFNQAWALPNSQSPIKCQKAGR